MIPPVWQPAEGDFQPIICCSCLSDGKQMGKPTSDEMKKMEVTLCHLCRKTWFSDCVKGSKEIPSGSSRDGLFEGQDIVRFWFSGKRCTTSCGIGELESGVCSCLDYPGFCTLHSVRPWMHVLAGAGTQVFFPTGWHWVLASIIS
jgi:hypothetical protein